jgi:uncharacterized protein (DUF427 family)
MSKSPGHQRHPQHRAKETRVAQKVTAAIEGTVIAESADVIRVDEDGQLPRYYFPRAAVKVDRLDRSTTTTKCPFKGTASYYTITQNGRRFDDAIWSYEDPYDEHAVLKGRIAFYDDKHPAITVAAPSDGRMQ